MLVRRRWLCAGKEALLVKRRWLSVRFLWKGVGGYECMSFGSFSLRELTCMHCVYLAL